MAAEKILERRPIAGLRSFNQLVIGGAFGDARSVPVTASRSASVNSRRSTTSVSCQLCALYGALLATNEGPEASAHRELGHAGDVRRAEIGDPEQDGAGLPAAKVEIDRVANDALFDGYRLTP
jgi:hypothetical protein